MAILVDSQTRLVVQGLTGREGRFHALRNRDYGTNVVAGVTPGKAGQDVEGIPVFNTVAGAVAETGANTSLIFVPARFAVDALYEAADAGIGVAVLITENIPVLDMTRAYNYIRAKGVALVGPNCPGVISPGKANVGIIPGEITHAGPVGLVSRSGTLTYQVMYEMAAAGVGQTTCVGIGGDPVVGSSFIDVLSGFQDDPETEAVVMIGEIGGDHLRVQRHRPGQGRGPGGGRGAGRPQPHRGRRAGRRRGQRGLALSLGEHHRAHDLVRERLAAGVPQRPQVAEVAGQGVDDVAQVAEEAHAPAHRLAVGHADQAQVQHLLAPALPGPSHQDGAVVDPDAERDQVEQERDQAGPGARGLARVGAAEQQHGQERGDGRDQVVDQVGADPLGPVGQRPAHVVAGLVLDVAAGGRGRRLAVAGLGGRGPVRRLAAVGGLGRLLAVALLVGVLGPVPLGHERSSLS
jgi:succinyl-CoA synthetase alpha subunit